MGIGEPCMTGIDELAKAVPGVGTDGEGEVDCTYTLRRLIGESG